MEPPARTVRKSVGLNLKSGASMGLKQIRSGSLIRRTGIVVVLAWAAMLSGCNNNGTVPPNQPDGSPPRLHLGSAGLSADINLDQTSTQPVSRRAPRSSSILLRAEANDPESGIANLELRGDLIIECIPTTSNNIVRIRDPIVVDQAGGQTSLPINLAGSYSVTFASQIARCPASTRFYQLAVALTATAKNGAGLEQRLPEARVRVFGPDQLRVATFNLFNPGNHPDSQFTTWGTAIGNVADVVLLTEVPDRRRAELLASAAGMSYVATLQDNYFTDVAIASRSPLRDISRLRVSSGAHGNDSNILSVVSDVGNFPHQFVANHWATRDANGTDAGPGVPVPGRLTAASRVIGLLSADDIPVVVGGDLNALAVTDEVAAFTSSGLSDAFVALGSPPGTHCSDKRIDYLFSRGPIAPSSYNACAPFASPSDHPFVAVTYLPR